MSPHSPLDTGSSHVPVTPQQTDRQTDTCIPFCHLCLQCRGRDSEGTPAQHCSPRPFSAPTQAPSCPGSSFPAQLFPELRDSLSSRQSPHTSQHPPSCTFPTLILLSCFTHISFSAHFVSPSCFISLLLNSRLFYHHKSVLFF